MAVHAALEIRPRTEEPVEEHAGSPRPGDTLRIAIVSGLFEPHVGGGAEIMARAVAEGLRDRGHSVSVVTTCAAKAGAVENGEVGGVPVLRLGLRNAYWHHGGAARPAALRALWHFRDMHNTGMARDLGRQLATLRPDVVMTHNLAGFSAAAWSAAAGLGIPVAHVLHDPYLLCPRSTMFRGGASCRRQCLSCRALRLRHAGRSRAVSAVVGVSRYILDLHLDSGYFAAASIRRVIHNARRLPAAAAAAESQSPEGAAPVRIGFLGTLSLPKGVLLLLDAFRRLVRERPGACELLVAGTGSAPLRPELERLAQGGPVRFLGHVAPERFFPRIDVLVVPSLWNDTFPGVVFEAFAYGVPVIGSRRGGIPEMIVDGDNGLLFEPDPAHGLVAALRSVLDPALRARLAAGAARSAGRYTDPEAMIGAYEEVLWQLHGRAPAVAAEGVA